MKYVISQPNSQTFAVAIIASSEEEVQREFNRLFNFGATTPMGRLHFIGKLGYFYTNKDLLVKAFENMKIQELLKKRNKGELPRRKGILAEVKQQAIEFFEGLERYNFLRVTESPLHSYSVSR